ncbi:hypothetical protein ACPCBC_10420 [Streptomyces incarnatus]|uniref:hypothetical protein n=1 Tax=Streptomyces sp. WP-1 TaxID=3041497 RepID=UPI002647ADCD|nr:hypothetical protein [Streptomyces sp. WP-1]WKE73172.1 hypothetical protein QHG49_31250 [Streptomyces sp. WP-1]
MSEYTTPSQAEGEREPEEAEAARQPARTTPSQAEGAAEESLEQDVQEGRD